jgi:toxin ParE1/3/4
VKLFWTHGARADRRSIRNHIATENPRAALALDERISEFAARLTTHPALGRPGRVAGTRELVVHANYIVIYDIAADTVRVLRILHAARQWPPAS